MCKYTLCAKHLNQRRVTTSNSYSFYIYISSLVKAVRSRLQGNFRSEAYSIFDIASSKRQDSKMLLSALLELLDEENDQICINSAELLFNLHGVESIMLTEAEGSYLLTSPPELMSQAVTEFTKVGTCTEDCLLVKMFQGATDDDGSIVNKLGELAAWCESENDETEPNSLVQDVAYSSGESWRICLGYSIAFAFFGTFMDHLCK